MDEDIHDMEDLFRSRLDPYLDDPSGETWEKLNARLDKDAAEKYKRRFYIVRTISICLLLVLLTVVGINILFVQQYNRDQKKILARQPPVVIQSKRKELVSNGPYRSPRIPDSNSDSEKHAGIEPLSDAIPLHNNITQKDAAPQSPRLLQPATGVHQEQDRPVPPPLAGINKNSRRTRLNGAFAGLGSSEKTRGHAQLSHTALTSSQAINDATDHLLQKRFEPTGLLPLHGALPNEIKVPSIGHIGLALAPSAPSVIKLAPFHPFWSLTAYVSRDWTDYNLADDDDVQTRPANRDDKSDVRHREEHEPSYSAGMLATYQFRKHLSFQSGLIYQRSNISVRAEKIYASRQTSGGTAYKYNVSSGYVYVKPSFAQNPLPGDSLLATEAQHSLHYITIPAILQYTWKLGRLNASMGAGVTANFLTAASIHAELENSIHREEVKIAKIQGIRDFYAGVLLKGSLNYEITPTWDIGIFPAFNYACMPITDKNIVKTYPFSTGIGVGIIYKPR